MGKPVDDSALDEMFEGFEFVNVQPRLGPADTSNGLVHEKSTGGLLDFLFCIKGIAHNGTASSFTWQSIEGLE